LKTFVTLAIKELEIKSYTLKSENNEFLLARAQLSLAFMRDLEKDIVGEVTLAITRKESYNHWGKHFLPSLNHAHLKQ